MDDNLKITQEELKIRLEAELLELKKEISEIATPDKTTADGFIAKETNTFEDVPDEGDLGAEMENIHTNNAVLQVLEERKKEVEDALQRMKEGKYGICEVCGKEIEPKRLLINAAATRCVKHMEV